MNETEQCYLDTWRRLDRIKAEIKARFTESCGGEPDAYDLANTCFHVWRLTNFHMAAMRSEGQLDEDRAEHALYVPPELAGERSERLRAMDAKLQEVLGDTVDVANEEPDEETEFDFSPSADEQILMVEYGSIICEHRWFIDALSGAIIEGQYVQNIVMQDVWGFDVLRGVMLRLATGNLPIEP